MIETLPEAVSLLDDVISYARGERHPVGYFAAVYRAVTAAELAHLREFDAPGRMERFAILFVEAFAGAFTAHLDGYGELPGWRGVFDEDLSVLESVVLAINSHVVWDLGLAIAELGETEGLLDDYRRVEQIARPVFDASWVALNRIAPRSVWLRRVVPAWFWPALLAHFRRRSWRFGMALLEHPDETATLCAGQLAYTRKIDARWRKVLAPFAGGECRDVRANLKVYAAELEAR